MKASTSILVSVLSVGLVASVTVPALAGDDAVSAKDAKQRKKLEKHYVGKHKLGVNRVNDGKRVGPASITKTEHGLKLEASVEKGKYWLKLHGFVEPSSKTEFVLDGVLNGVPNLEWRGEGPKELTTEARFTFRATKGRRFWRLYEVDGKECVCNDGCGNEFCYVDLSFR